MEEMKESNLKHLELLNTIGFQGKVRNGLLSHPDRTHIVYGVGHTVVIKNLLDMTQHCLHGHSNSVSCLAMSSDGSLLASGQINYMGFRADVIIWDFYARKKIASHNIHKVRVESVAFSCNSNYVVSLGGEDDRNVVIYDVKSCTPLCGAPSGQFIGGYSTVACCANLNDTIFFAAGRENLRMWKIDHANRKVHPFNVPVGQLKREILCLVIDEKDEILYCGTSSGDLMKVRLNLSMSYEHEGMFTYVPKMECCLGKELNPRVLGDSPLFGMGITALLKLRTGHLFLGTGQGIVCQVVEKNVFTEHKYLAKVSKQIPATSKPVRIMPEMRLCEIVRCQVMGAVLTMAVRGDGHELYVGTKTCEIYRLTVPGLQCQMLFTCHGCAIHDVVFPFACHQLFATCSLESIRIWNTETCQEVLRITVPNMTCKAIFFSYDGHSLISGWNDGKIRVHTPEHGQLLYAINEAHQKGVTALAVTKDSMKIVSGGGEGEVRIWQVNPASQTLCGVMKEHKGAITSIRLKSNDKECVSSGADGSCIIWDLERLLRIQVVFANTLFQSVCYGPEECQILTCGTDRKIGYWEVFDGTQIRELVGSTSGSVNALDISEHWETFVSGGCDKILKFWSYQGGIVTHIGVGHSDEINAVRISSGMKIIISVSKDGSIFIWKYPEES